MPSREQELQEQIEESVKLTKQMLDNQDGLETKIKELEAKGVGAADLKEQVSKMSDDNAKAIDRINELEEELKTAREEAEKRQDEFETKFGRGGVGGDGADLDIAAPIVKALPEVKSGGVGMRGGEPIMGFQEKVKCDVDMKSLVFGKTVTSLAASAGDAQIPTYEPQIIAPGQQAITLLDVLPRTMTESPLIYWVVEVLGSRTNNVDIQSLDFTGTGQGTALGESDFVFDQKSSETRTYGHTAKIALQILEDVGQLRGYLENQMRYMVRYDLEDQVLNGDNTSKNFNGIKNQATAYDATLDNTVGVTGIQNLDVLRLAIMQTALTFFPATAMILHPYETTGLELIKDGDGNYMFANPNSGNGVRPWGVPVVSTTQQTAGDFTVGAMNLVEIAIRKSIEVLISTENEDDFDNLLATMRAYGRGGLKIYQPGSIIDGDFATAKA